LNAGTTYRFRVKARNDVGYSSYSSVISIVAAVVPSKPSAPTTSISADNLSVIVSWDLPTDTGGVSIDSYKLEIKTSTSTYETETVNCDAENDSTIISSRTCTILASTLSTSTYNLQASDSVYARVTAYNSEGASPTSDDGNGAVLPNPPTEPGTPTSLVQDSASKT